MAIATYTFQNGDNYPLFPTDPPPTSWDIKHTQRTVVSDSRSQKRSTRAVGGPRIEATFNFPPMRQDNTFGILEFLRYVEGGHQIFAFRMPLMLPTSSYSDGTLHVGEYYNINHVTNDNQLVMLLDDDTTDTVHPPVRAGTTPLLSLHTAYEPHLKCSLKGPAQVVKYASDGYVRVSIDVVERW